MFFLCLLSYCVSDLNLFIQNSGRDSVDGIGGLYRSLLVKEEVVLVSPAKKARVGCQLDSKNKPRGRRSPIVFGNEEA